MNEWGGLAKRGFRTWAWDLQSSKMARYQQQGSFCLESIADWRVVAQVWSLCKATAPQPACADGVASLMLVLVLSCWSF